MSVIVNQSYENLPKKQVIQNENNLSGWSFLQALSETKGIHIPKSKNETEKSAYIHPIEKRSLPKLNEKSLEMCTESLGTENGSESGDEFSFLALEATNSPIVRHQETNIQMKKPEIVNPKNSLFPPLINSVKGFKYSRMVKSYGEDGRVLVKAIRVCSLPRCFVSERSEGRLRLCLSQNTRDEEDDSEEDEKEEEEEEEEGIDGNNENLEGKIGNSKISSRRCNENPNGNDSKAMLNWKQQQFWVTT